MTPEEKFEACRRELEQVVGHMARAIAERETTRQELTERNTALLAISQLLRPEATSPLERRVAQARECAERQVKRMLGVEP